jgi:hypothetical protein
MPSSIPARSRQRPRCRDPIAEFVPGPAGARQCRKIAGWREPPCACPQRCSGSPFQGARRFRASAWSPGSAPRGMGGLWRQPARRNPADFHRCGARSAVFSAWPSIPTEPAPPAWRRSLGSGRRGRRPSRRPDPQRPSASFPTSIGFPESAPGPSRSSRDFWRSSHSHVPVVRKSGIVPALPAAPAGG